MTVCGIRGSDSVAQLCVVMNVEVKTLLREAKAL